MYLFALNEPSFIIEISDACISFKIHTYIYKWKINKLLKMFISDGVIGECIFSFNTFIFIITNYFLSGGKMK